MRQCLVLAILPSLAFSTACDDRLPPAVDGGVDGPPPVVDARSPDTSPPGECVIAIRTDDCCQLPVPVATAQVDADPCLVLWPPVYPLDASCRAKWPSECDRVDCRDERPPSRAVERVDGVCQFVDECQTIDDCVFATNMRVCCPCADVYPPGLVAQDVCLVLEGQQVPSACLPDCTNVQCEMCIPPPVVNCALTPAPEHRTCRGLWPD